jgi:hypothetical protein
VLEPRVLQKLDGLREVAGGDRHVVAAAGEQRDERPEEDDVW